jgi:hypothetical protein
MLELTAFLILFVLNVIVLGFSFFIGTLIQAVQIGRVATTAPKVLVLLIVVTAIMLFVPFGFRVAVPVWFVGFIVCFDTPPRDALVLAGVALGVGFVMRFVIFALLVSLSSGG